MPFNTALSGLRAAQGDLQVTGNNIANASTVGFKQSRAEFSDVYAASVLGSGSNAIGSGVLMNQVAQQFSQGTINFTENALDLAINGSGFFQMDESGSRSYTRSGQFGLDADGTIVNSAGAALLGQLSENGGEPDGATQALQLDINIIPPSRTTGVEQEFNLNSSESVKAIYTTGVDLASSAGSVISEAQSGSTNGYTQTNFTLSRSNGSTSTHNIPSVAGTEATASNIALELNDIDGVTAVASTSAVLSIATLGGTASTELTLGGNNIGSDTRAGIVAEINNLRGYSASLVVNAAATPDTLLNEIIPSGGLAENDIVITRTNGDDINFDVTNGTTMVATVSGVTPDDDGIPNTLRGAAPLDLVVDADVTTDTITVGGNITLTFDDTITEDNAVVINSGNILGAAISQNSNPETNTFSASDTNTYNHVTSMTVYDSLGNAHAMTQYFVKESSRSDAAEEASSSDNVWSMYVQIDGEDVGPANVGETPSVARFTLAFEPDGTFSATENSTIAITNWTPRDESGQVGGASGPDQNAVAPNIVTDPPSSSNFRIDLAKTTIFGGSFDVKSISQDGFTQGKLSALEVTDDGTIFARFTNGEAQSIGRVQLARFNNPQGLAPVGNSAWVETFESGVATAGVAGSSSLGLITAGAVEESNVDLSSELVNLILAQRNFQANAKTIETVNAVTQTIINLR